MKKPLELKLNDLDEEGRDLHVDQGEAGFAALLREIDLGAQGERSGRAELHLVLWPKRLDVDGELHARLPARCDRCLTPFEQRIDHGFRQILMREPDERAPIEEDEDEGSELRGADLDRGQLSGDHVDLAELLREELQLALPAKNVCKEDCAGLCNGCGLDLNREACACEAAVDPRWGALQGLKLDN